MPVILTLDGRQFTGHGICGNVANWNAGGVVVPPCHGHDLIAIDDHHHADAQGRRLGPPGGGQTAAGLHYETPIDCRRLFFDDPNGSRRTFGMEGAAVDLPLRLDPGQRLIFSWKFISSGAGSRNNSFALALAYPTPPPPAAPVAAPPIGDLGKNGPEPPRLLDGAIRIPMDGPVQRLNEARTAVTPDSPLFHARWNIAHWSPPAGGFDGLIRWIVCTGWRVSADNDVDSYWKKKRRKSTRVRQRALPATLLLDCVEIE